MDEIEMEQGIAELMNEGRVMAFLKNGVVKFITSDHKKNIPSDAVVIGVREVAERERWTWWFQQN